MSRSEFHLVEQGGGRVERNGGTIRLVRPAIARGKYANAQIGDPAAALTHQSPVLLRLRARFSHSVAELSGTAGFGFWNATLSPGQLRPRPPRACWFFFSSPPHDIQLALGVPGHGPKAAVLDANRPPFFALLPLALPGFAAMRLPSLYRRLWPFAQWAIGVDEASLTSVDLKEWHDYSIEWRPDRVTFAVDGESVLSTRRVPGGPLSLAIWFDNAYAIATPRGQFALGTVEASLEQWLEVDSLLIEPRAGISE